MKITVQIAGAYECAGFFNIKPCRSMPEIKGKFFLNYQEDQHNFYGAITTSALTMTEDRLQLVVQKH